MTRHLRAMARQAKEKLLSFLPSKFTVFLIVIVLIAVGSLFLFLTRKADLEEVRIKNYNEALKNELIYSGAANDAKSDLKKYEIERLYWNAVKKGNSQTGVAQDPSKSYRLKDSQIKIEISIDGTSSGTTSGSAPSGRGQVNPPLKPEQLFYTTNILDKCYVSQTEKEHFKSNGRLATDIACSGQKVMIYAPDYNNMKQDYKSEFREFPDTGNTVILHFRVGQTPYFWLIGHISEISEKSKYITGEGIGYMDLSGITSGYHSHIELWQGESLEKGTKVSYSSSTKALIKMRTSKTSGFKWGDRFYFTHYDLGDKKQNDDDPCIGADGQDHCKMNSEGRKTMALTRDVREDLGIRKGDKVRLEGPCGGIYEVRDEMDCRFRGRFAFPDDGNGNPKGICYLTDGKTPASSIGGNIYRNGYLIKGDIPSVNGCKGGVHSITKA